MSFLTVIPHHIKGLSPLLVPQWLVETTNEVFCGNELELLVKSDAEPQARLHATDALFTALNESRDMVEITDNEYNVVVSRETGQLASGGRGVDAWGISGFSVLENRRCNVRII